MSHGKRYLFTGGGTGGHVTPNLAIIHELVELEPEAVLLYVGSPHGPEGELLRERGVPFQAVPCHAFVSPRRPLRFILFLALLVAGTLKALWIQLRFKPRVVVATGGYASVPAVLAAALLRKAIFLHEQNVKPGRANLFLARFATRIGVSFEETLEYFPEGKAVVSGYPVRRRIAAGNAVEARERLQIPADHRVAFVVGGSMGARSINRGMIEGLGRLLANESVTVIHSTGLARSASYDAWQDTNDRLRGAEVAPGLRGRYILRRYFDQIEDAYAACDLVVTRAGAGVVMELATMGKPALLIPKSDGADNHQLVNALSLRERGIAEVLLEEMYDADEGPITRVHGDQLARKIDELLADAGRLETMSRSARQLIVPDAGPHNAALVRELTQEKKLSPTTGTQQLSGSLTDEAGCEHELLFTVTTLSRSRNADLRITTPGARAMVRRIGRSREDTEFRIIPGHGRVTVDGDEIKTSTRVLPGQSVTVGDDTFVFNASIKTIEEPRPSRGFLGKVLATGLGTLLSRVFGLAREIVLATSFGTGRVLDLFAASLTASNLLRRVFAENAMDSAFLPTYLLLRREGRREEAGRLFASVFTWTVLLTGSIVVVSALTIEAWLPIVVPGFDDKGMLEDSLRLTRIMLPYLILVSVAALFGALLRAGNRFAVPAWSSIFFSVGVIAGVALYPYLGVAGLGVGVLLGGAGQVLIHLPTLLSKRFRESIDLSLRPRLDASEPGMRKIRATAPKIVADVTVDKLSPLVDVAIVSTLAVGNLSVLYLGLLLVQLPFAIISQSINVVALKEFSESLAARDQDACRRLIVQGIRWTVFLLLPVSIGLALFAEPIVDLFLQYRSFSAQDSRLVAIALACYALGLVGWGLQALTGRFFAARLEITQAMYINIAAVIANIVISVSLVLAGFSFAGIALGTTVAMLGGGVFRVYWLQRNLAREGAGFGREDLAASLAKTSLATAGAALVGFLSLQVVRGFDAFPALLSRLVILGIPTTMSLLTFGGLAAACGSPEMRQILARLNGLLPAKPRSMASRPPMNPYCLRPEQLLRAAIQHPEAVREAAPRRRVKSFLSRPSWKQKNIGVKLVGLLKLIALRYELVAIITDREAAPWYQRLFGGDYLNPGFVRRNAVHALVQLESVDEGAERAILIALDDPYFEVRSAAAQAVKVFARQFTPPSRLSAIEKLARLSKGRNFEVAMHAVEGLAAAALDDGVLEILEGLHYHANWQVRHSVVRAYHELYRRGIVEDRGRIMRLLDDVLVTCDAFHPTFELKETLLRVRRGLETPSDRESQGDAAVSEAEMTA
ncbi:MAG: murein biosynthesis integral membrane protein MurJ [Planctomycetes bacterium]|nr:murein biosynthesis integral membrane protein MurJ [Planctomycetota bacterium]